MIKANKSLIIFIISLSALLFILLLINACGFPPDPNEKVDQEALRLERIKNTAFYKQVVIPYENHVLNTRSSEGLPPGVAVAIVQGGEICYLNGIGEKRINSNDKIDTETVFRIASVSKGFAAVLIGKLVEEGILDWEDKVVDYVPSFKLKDSIHAGQLTIRHVLSHTTGMPRHTYGNLIEARVPFAKILEMLPDVNIVSKPGELFSYQNVMYNLITPICEKATDKDYGTLVKEYIFAPLGMDNASISYEAIMNATNVAQPHNNHSKRVKKIKEAYYKVLPSAGVNASITDMAKYTLALLGHKKSVLSDDLRTAIFKSNVKLPGDNRYSRAWKKVSNTGYGMGWRLITYDDIDLVYHGGFVNGYRAEMAMNLEDDLGIVVLTNSFSKFANQCIPDFFDLYKIYKKKQAEIQSVSSTATAKPVQK